jgi:hypothetical protein
MFVLITFLQQFSHLLLWHFLLDVLEEGLVNVFCKSPGNKFLGFGAQSLPQLFNFALAA